MARSLTDPEVFDASLPAQWPDLSDSCRNVTVGQKSYLEITITFHSKMPDEQMVLYHCGAAIWPSSTRRGNTFVAHACVLKDDGEPVSLEDLGQFASRSCAYAFALRCATAFVDGKPLPRKPFCADSERQ